MIAKCTFPAILLSAVALAAPPIAAQDDNCRAERWEETIAEFEQQDEQTPPPKGGVLFVGSSSIRMWDLDKWFPDMRAINRGFGGSEICDSTHYFDRLVAKHKPHTVVLYAGDNDIAGGKSPGQVLDDFRNFSAKMQEKLPDARLVFISIKPSIARWKLSDAMLDANQQIAGECGKHEQLHYLSVWQPMLGDDGRPRKELFARDGLHLNDEGYRLWTELLVPLLDD